MKKINKKNLLVSAASVATAATLLFSGATYAYLQDETEDKVNTFNANKVLVEIAEDGDGQYNIIPGTEETKNPTVTVDASTAAYVFVKVTDKTEGMAGYTIADGWTELTEFSTDTEKIYYRTVEGSTEKQTFSVLLGDKVTYDKSITNDKMINADGSLKEGLTLTFKASAIQQEGFADAKSAWLQVPAEVATTEELQAELASEKTNIKLSDNVAITSPQNTEYNMADGAVLDLNEKTLDSPYMTTIFQGNDVKIQNGAIESRADYSLFIGNGSIPTTAVVENVTLDGGINVFVADVTLRNVTVDATSKGYYAVWADEAATITIESGTYIARAGTHAVRACDLGTVIIKGGTFSSDVSAYVAEGYKLVPAPQESGETWYTVVPAANA